MADATAKLSGYLASATSVAFTGTQTLASLADNEYTNLSDEYDNSTNLYALVDVLIAFTSTFTPTGSDAGISLYLIPCVDGTNYPDWTGDTTTTSQENFWFVGSSPVKAAAGTRYVVFPRIPLYNGKQKWAVRNEANVAFPSSGTTFYVRPHSLLSDEA